MSAIQIKDVPEQTHRRLRERARQQGRSLSQYALEVLERDLELPSTHEWLQRMAEDEPVSGITSEEIVELIHEGRVQGDEQTLRALADRH